MQNIHSAKQDIKSSSAGSNSLLVVDKNYQNDKEYDDDHTSHIDKKLLRHLLFKIDMRVIPLLSLCYLSSCLDRANIGNAKIAGLTETIDITENEYNVALSIFFAGYILFQLPSNILLNKIGPRIWISCIMVMFGCATASMAAVKNGTQLIIARMFLGICESGLTPAITFYASVWYTKGEISKRFAIMFANGTIAGVVGGFMAYGIMFMDQYQDLYGWQWIFLIEAFLTIAIGIAVFLFLPDFPNNNITFMNAEERRIFLIHKENSPASFAKFEKEEENDENTSWWIPIIQAFKDWHAHALGILMLCTYIPAYSMAFFMPSIIYNFGVSPLVTQLMTTVPNFVASLLGLAVAFSVDYYKEIGLHSAASLLISIIGFALMIILKDQGTYPLYAAIILATAGIGPLNVTLASWPSCNFSGRMKRSAAIAITNAFGNIGGAVSGQLFRESDAPQYIHGNIASLIFVICSFIGCVGIKLVYRHANLKRDTMDASERENILAKDNATTLGDKHPDFRYIS
ncbi:major facilitator superfamily domain-containing protein [Phascolomyces articulosus]|uniref:Major facilitator superfamily domain-containing protein n=1 Tax=Phascolomyces articulosus TaxID=60185 RepID=A0AAD5K941_9FUNG|nr:major facilitator superfamily domain-containing protein [Phascolomyces articulosus]